MMSSSLVKWLQDKWYTQAEEAFTIGQRWENGIKYSLQHQFGEFFQDIFKISIAFYQLIDLVCILYMLHWSDQIYTTK